MIKHIRIDNRLIHGQVAAAWKNNIGADAIIVCNDDVAKDPITYGRTRIKSFSFQHK